MRNDTRPATVIEHTTLQHASQANNYLSVWEINFVKDMLRHGENLTVTKKQAESIADIQQNLNKVERYFLVNFVTQDCFFGNFGHHCKGFPAFPNNRELEKIACKQAKKQKDQVIITGLFEFKSRLDFETFLSN